MRVLPTGQAEYHNGNEVGRYGRDFNAGISTFVWYHGGISGSSEPTWAMDTDVHYELSVSIDTILVADENHGLYAIDADRFTERTVVMDGREQYIASASDDYVERVGHPRDHLFKHLWIESGNQVNEGYHKAKNEA